MARGSRGWGNNRRLFGDRSARKTVWSWNVSVWIVRPTDGRLRGCLSFGREKKKKNPLLKESVLQSVSAGQAICQRFLVVRWAVSPEQTIGISVGFTHKVERISFGRYLGAEHAHVICRRGCTSGIAAKRSEWSVVFRVGIWVLRAVCLSGISDEGARWRTWDLPTGWLALWICGPAPWENAMETEYSLCSSFLSSWTPFLPNPPHTLLKHLNGFVCMGDPSFKNT